jgi:hypothetical protein
MGVAGAQERQWNMSTPSAEDVAAARAVIARAATITDKVKIRVSAFDKAAKAFVASGALAITALQPVYGHSRWFVAAVAGYGALSTYFARNL